MKNLSVLNNAEAARALGQLMHDQGHTLFNATTVLEAVDRMEEETWDVFIPSFNLGNGTGMELITQLRERRNAIPILILDEEELEDDVRLERTLECLNAGADDYLGHAYRLEEVIARVKALGRRVRRKPRQIETIGPLVIDYDDKRVWVSGTPLQLSRREYMLLEFLCHHRGVYHSREAIGSVIEGKAAREWHIVDVLIYRIRRKLRPFIEGPSLIDTKTHSGYRLNA